ncbi:MAG: GNAT family N-acetyltransferase [Candidatus Bathyarchaeia archaeon]
MLAEIETHPDVMRWNIDVYAGDKTEMYRSFKEAIERLQIERDKLFLVGKLDGKVIGFVGVKRKNENPHIGDVGISVHPNYWNRGFGTCMLKFAIEKARDEGFLKLELETLAANKAMLRIAEKIGFEVEGIRKVKRNENYENVVLMGMNL